MTYLTVLFPVILNDSYPGFKVTILLKGKYYSNWCILYGLIADNCLLNLQHNQVLTCGPSVIADLLVW